MNLDVELLAVRGKAVTGECWKSSHKSESQAVQTTYQHLRFSECILPRMCCNSKVLRKYCVLFMTKNLAAITRRKTDSSSYSHNHKDKIQLA